MKCPRCGAENAPENRYCESCGAPLDAQAYNVNNANNANQTAGFGEQAAKVGREAKEQVDKIVDKVKSDKKLLGWIIKGAVALVALIVLIVIISAVASSGSPYDFIKSAPLPIMASNGDETEVTILQGGDKLPNKLDGIYQIYATSMDLKAAVALDENGDIYKVGENGFEHVIDGAQRVVIAQNGSTIAYTDEEATLYLLTLKNNKKTKIEDDVDATRGIVMSPDGKYVAYCVTDDDGDSDFFVYNGKKSVLIDDAVAPIALSNGGKYIYCFNTDNRKLYVYNMKGAESKKVLKAEIGGDFILNKDNTQLMFSASDGDYFVSIKGEDPIKLRSSMRPITPAMTQSFASSGWYSATTVGVGSLADMFYRANSYELGYLNKNWEFSRVTTSFDSAVVNQKGDTVYYMRNDSLYRVKKDKLENPDEIAEDVDSFVMAPNGSYVYYIDDDETLWYCKGTGKPKRIADEVSEVCLTHDGIALFITEYSEGGGTLCSSKNGGKMARVMEDVYADIMTAPDGTYILANYSQETYTVDVYGTDSKTDFELLIEDVNP